VVFGGVSGVTLGGGGGGGGGEVVYGVWRGFG
jgi:hypothetical protein